MVIGIPKEIMKDERRVSATPETVQKFIQDGFAVVVERGAGSDSYFEDNEYEKAGAQLKESALDVFKAANIVLKVKEPMFNKSLSTHELDMINPDSLLITFLHPASPANHEMVHKLAERNITALTLDGIPRITRAQQMDALTSMSTCAGYKGMIMAVDKLTKFAPQMFTAVGMIKPINVLVIGVGVAGLQAMATAKRLGAIVYAADIRPDAIETIRSLGAKVVDTKIPSELAVADGGYALSLQENWLETEREALAQVIPNMDIVYCSALVPGKKAPILITEQMVKSMAKGSVIVDVSIDQGGNCEITTPGVSDIKHGVVIEGIKNIPGMLPTSATWMFANNVYNLVKYLAKDASITLDMSDDIVKSALVTHKGEIVHSGAKEAMGL